MSDERGDAPPPGLDDARLVRLMREAIARCRLDLSGLVVLTEAATGAYRVTPVLAALAGARAVYALTRASAHGTIDEVRAQTDALAQLAGVRARIEIVTGRRRDLVAQADIVTNSGHMRPIDAELVSWMKPSAVVPLMFEAWEFRAADVDLAACRRRGILVAGTDEADPTVGVSPYLGTMAVKLLLDAGLPVRGCRVLLVCDNPFMSFMRDGLIDAGAHVEARADLHAVGDDAGDDAVLVALTPRADPRISDAEAAALARRWPTTIVAQFWGDIDRAALRVHGVRYWPRCAPAPGHMGILPSALGPDPVVRLQAGGLKVGEVLFRTRRHPEELA